MRRAIRAQDIFWWEDAFLNAGTAYQCTDASLLEDYAPIDR
jgi:hypothetical protein